MWREVIRERRFRGLLCKAAGVQCNGTPTFDAYRSLNNNCQLFFDSRTTRDMLVGAAVLAAKHAEMVSGHSLRLVFSGRLTSIKGVDHLPRLAAELRKKGVDFTLDIFGDGALANEVAQDVRARDLSDVVRLRGVARFQEELVPFVSRHSDLFVCCHRQGDPSCTYLETMACGVPVAGYANEALAGLVSHSGAAWTVAMDDIGALSTRICELDRNRGTILAASQKAREFAEANTFEVTMSRRVAHLLACLYKGKHGEASTAMSDAVADAHRGSRRLANQ